MDGETDTMRFHLPLFANGRKDKVLDHWLLSQYYVQDLLLVSYAAQGGAFYAADVLG
jgi:hypothetical protein